MRSIESIINSEPEIIIGLTEERVDESEISDDIEPTQNESESENDNGGWKAKRYEMLLASARKHGLLKTKEERMKHSEIGTEEIKFSNTPKLNIEGSLKSMEKPLQKTLRNSDNCSDILEKTSLDSMSLLEDTAKHLHGLMLGMTANSPSPELVKVQPEVMNAAANAANSIYKIKRLQLDATKLLKEIRENK